MKIIGFLLILVYWNSLEYQFSFTALAWLIVGVCLVVPEALKGILKRVNI